MQAEIPTKTLRFREIGDAHLCTRYVLPVDRLSFSFVNGRYKGRDEERGLFFPHQANTPKKVVNEGGGTASNSSCRKHFSHIPMSN